MKKLALIAIAVIFLSACSLITDGKTLPYDIEIDTVNEISVMTYNQEGSYEIDKEWTNFIEVVSNYSYKSTSVNKVEEIWALAESVEDYYAIVFDCNEELYSFFIFDDMIIANNINVFSSEDEKLQYFIAQHNDIKTLYEELSELDFPSNTLRIEKPVIYLYPEMELDIKVLINPEDIITTSYPKYDNGWSLTAKPNGEILDEEGRKYSYLFWEGDIEFNCEIEDGFIVQKDDIVNFLESKLDILGLNYVEKNDFITYWLPALEKYEYNKIRFYTKEVNELVQLEITPEPQTVIRVYMIFEKANESDYIAPQILESIKRQGYTVVEWGGAELK